MRLLTRLVATFALAFPVFNSLSAQRPPVTDPLPLARKRTPDEPLVLTRAGAPEKSEFWNDTLPDYNFRMYDPARRHTIDYGTIGLPGGAARPLLFEVIPRLGVTMGVNSFDLYMLHAEDLRFFRNKRSYSEAYFTQGRNNLNTQLDARFARTFSDSMNVSLDYRSLNNVGQYNYQRDRHNSLAAGIWKPVGKRYEYFLIFTKSVIRQRDNGGIVSDDVFSGAQFQGPLAAAIRLPEESATTRFEDQGFQYTQHYKLAGVGTGKRTLRLSHSLGWTKNRFKFYDGDTIRGLADNAGFYGPFLVDERGVRQYFELNTVTNNISLNTFRAKTAGTPSDLAALGLRHDYMSLYQEPGRFRYNNLFLTGKISLTPSDRFNFNADAALGMWKNIGEYQLSGTLSLGLGKAGVLTAALFSQRRPPTILQQRLFVTNVPVWQTDFAKPVESSLSATYALPSIGFQATASTMLVNNYIYFDQEGIAAQTTAPLQVARLILQENIRIGHFHLDNTLALQKANRSDVLHLPEWFTKNSLYYSGKLFDKKLDLHIGLDFRMNSTFLPDAYQPVTGQFHLQDTLSQQPYPWADVFVAFKVQTFRFFFRYENAYTFIDNTKVFYQTAWHPQPFGGFRLGVAWRFLDDNSADSQNNQ
ncbi:MAG: hypothetical protein RJA20_1706 [Bacteroidota bacterium]